MRLLPPFHDVRTQISGWAQGGVAAGRNVYTAPSLPIQTSHTQNGFTRSLFANITDIGMCGWHFHPKEFATCRPFSWAYGASQDDTADLGGWFSVFETHHHHFQQTISFDTRSPSDSPTNAPSSSPSVVPSPAPTPSPVSPPGSFSCLLLHHPTACVSQ